MEGGGQQDETRRGQQMGWISKVGDCLKLVHMIPIAQQYLPIIKSVVVNIGLVPHHPLVPPIRVDQVHALRLLVLDLHQIGVLLEGGEGGILADLLPHRRPNRRHYGRTSVINQHVLHIVVLEGVDGVVYEQASEPVTPVPVDLSHQQPPQVLVGAHLGRSGGLDGLVADGEEEGEQYCDGDDLFVHDQEEQMSNKYKSRMRFLGITSGAPQEVVLLVQLVGLMLQLRLLPMLLALRVLVLGLVGQIAEHLLLQHLPSFPGDASLRLPPALPQKILDVVDELVVLDPALLGLEPAIDGELVILLGELLVLLLEYAVVALEEVLLHHGALQLVAQGAHLGLVVFVFADEVLDLLFVDAVELGSLQPEDAFLELQVLLLEATHLTLQPFRVRCSRLVGRLRLVGVVGQEDLPPPRGRTLAPRLLPAHVPQRRRAPPFLDALPLEFHHRTAKFKLRKQQSIRGRGGLG